MVRLKKMTFGLTIFLFSILSIRFVYLRYYKYNDYYNLYINKNEKYLYVPGAKRGRILDTNGKVIVDNKQVPIINYRKSNLKTSEEIELAYNLINILPVSTEATTEELKSFYLLTNETDYLLTEEEEEQLKFREIDQITINKRKKERITDELNKYTLKDRLAISVYYKMNTGYKSDTKLILDNTTDTICAKIVEANLQGVTCDYKWVRVNNYNTLASIIGKTGQIAKEEKSYYQRLNYLNNEIVGISGLEKYYEEILHGIPAKYLINSDNSLTLVSEEVSGQDLILSIDIELQKKIEEIIINNLKNAKNFHHTDLFNTAYAVVGNPKTGEIVAASGLTLLKNNNYESIKDVTSNIILSSFTVGSVVKGASHTVGYLNNAIEVGKKINDSCVKLYSVPEKCSYKKLGLIDDITALKTSSNYYQFLTAIKVTGNIYKRNMNLKTSEEDFNKYRQVFKNYGLGDLTYIDFPKENIGITGKNYSADLLLNFAIGQYDTYTPLQLLAYINTIATKGKRYKLSFRKQNNELASLISLEEKYYDRIIEGFSQVLKNGTGRGYTNTSISSAGKTGTAESYYDNNITAINSSFVAFAPVDNPKYSLVVLTPNVSYVNNEVNYPAPINRYISRQISDVLFAN